MSDHKFFDDFFADWTVERAAAFIAKERARLAEVKAALAADDWPTLVSLDVARLNRAAQGDAEMGVDQSSYVLLEGALEELRRTVAMPPEQLAAQMNSES